MKLSKVVVATDFSKQADSAVHQAMNVCRHTGAELVLAHSYPLTVTQADAAEAALGVEPFRARLRMAMEATHKRLEAERERVSGQGVDVSQVLADSPPERGVGRVRLASAYSLRQLSLSASQSRLLLHCLVLEPRAVTPV